MAKTLSEDLRTRLIAAVEAGASRRTAAERFGVAASTAVHWVKAFRMTGTVTARPKGGDLRSHRIEAFHDATMSGVEVQKDITWLNWRRCSVVSMARRFRPARCIAFWYAIRLRSKKAVHAAEQGRPDVARMRQAWFEARPDLDPERLVFIDETGANTKMTRLRGRAPRGQRCRAAVPHGYWKTTTFVGALRLEGMTAPLVLDGPMNGRAFRAYVEQALAPRCAQATSSSWTICPPIKSLA